MKNNLPVEKVLVAMSGGVDSSVAAALLVNQGYEIIGLHFLTWKEDYGQEKKNLADLAVVTKALNIPLEIVDIKKEFKKWIVDRIISDYKIGLTPNPCIICNQKIKFNLLLKIADKLKCDFIATGHYARIEKIEYRKRTEYALLKAKNQQHDQSYFLYRLKQNILAKTIFSNGLYSKDQVRSLADRFHLPVANKADSQEICFIADEIKSFLKRQIPDYLIPGRVVNLNNEAIGEHYGLPLYTIGQRHGFTISEKLKVKSAKLATDNKRNTDGKPLYVIAKDIRKNQLVVGLLEQAKRAGFEIESVNWIRETPDSRYKMKVKIKIRNTGNLLDGTVIYSKKDNSAKVLLSEPVLGISPGQSAVFYSEKEVLGGGIIRWQ